MQSIYKTYGIYEIRCSTNNKVYVGKTINTFGDRWDSHKAKLRNNYHDNKDLQNDWNTYGEESFEFNIIKDLTGESKEVVSENERVEIKKAKETGLCYNITDGEGFLGLHLSEEAKRVIGEKNRINMTGRKMSDETKRKKSEAMKAHFASLSNEEMEEVRERARRNNREHPMTDEGKKRLSERMKDNKNGAKFTEEIVRNIRIMYEKENMTIKEISEKLNICYGTIRGIVKYDRWKNVTIS